MNHARWLVRRLALPFSCLAVLLAVLSSDLLRNKRVKHGNVAIEQDVQRSEFFDLEPGVCAAVWLWRAVYICRHR